MGDRTISRRTVLRGLGTAMALPLLEAMEPLRAFATGGAPRPPIRLAFHFVPNGVNTAHWTPAAPGKLAELPFTLSPLEPVKDWVNVLSGLAHDKARANGDGAGDHARSAAAFLTSSQPRKTNGADIRAGISADQLAAQKVGDRTRFASLELGIDRNAMAGNCDSGYSCAYSSTISWKSPTEPLPKEINPRAAFERLFGDPKQSSAAQERARAAAERRSVLDLVEEDARALEKELGGADRRKLDEYLESVRTIERQIQAAEQERAARPAPKLDIPEGSVKDDYPRHLRIMLDLQAVAFQTDTTRISTLMYANEGSNRSFPFIDVRDGHHTLSHHGRNPEKLEKIKKIDHFYVQQFAAYVQKLRSIKEGDRTLLDSCMVVYGCAIGDGNRHNHNDLPVLLAGKGGGTIATGRHVQYAKDTPMANLYLSLLDRMGVEEERFGDSTGRLNQLTA